MAEYYSKKRTQKVLWLILFYGLLILTCFILRPTLFTDLGYYTRPIWDTDPNKFEIIPHYYGENVPLKNLCEIHGWSLKPEPRTKVYDAIVFSVELDLLEVRIRELWEEVDVFVILESNATFTGRTKNLTFMENKHKFEFAASKIHHVAIEQYALPAGEGPFYNENAMRRAMDAALVEAGIQQDDLVVMSDVDEIVRAQTLHLLKSCEGVPDVLHLQMRNYIYSFEFYLDSNSWRAHVVKYNVGSTAYTHGQITKSLLSDAGWHCSFCFRTIGDFQFKMKSYSHADRVKHPKLLDADRIQEKICSGKDIFDMPPEAYTYKDLISKLGNIKPSTSGIGLPSFVLNDPQKYKFLLPGGCIREDFSA